MSKDQRWASQIGAIFAVASAAVGLGNFLRFPGKAAAYGGGVFMIPYFICLIVLGVPIAWAEWTLGRYGGSKGVHSAPAVFRAVWPRRISPYIGTLSLIVPFGIYVYYLYIETWCLAYTWYYATGVLPNSAVNYGEFFNNWVGARSDGAFFMRPSGWLFLAISMSTNLFLVYRGLRDGIEKFCTYAMPLLIVLGLVLLSRVLTLGTPNPALPQQSVINGLGFMWNPHTSSGEAAWTALLHPQVWLEAASQIFFTLGVAFGIIICYASYVGRDSDIVLSAFSAAAANEFCEVCLGGLITLPAAFVFLGSEPLKNVLGSQLGLGFHAFPEIFGHMAGGRWFGAIWFFLLFIAAITSSIAMVHPVNVFFEEHLGVSRKNATLISWLLNVIGTLIVVYFSKSLVALDTLDFWVGTVLMFVLGGVLVLLFGWGFSKGQGLEEANRGAAVMLPRWIGLVLRWISPLLVLIILGFWLALGAAQQVSILQRSTGAQWAMGYVVFIAALFVGITWRGQKRLGLP